VQASNFEILRYNRRRHHVDSNSNWRNEYHSHDTSVRVVLAARQSGAGGYRLGDHAVHLAGAVWRRCDPHFIGTLARGSHRGARCIGQQFRDYVSSRALHQLHRIGTVLGFMGLAVCPASGQSAANYGDLTIQRVNHHSDTVRIQWPAEHVVASRAIRSAPPVSWTIPLTTVPKPAVEETRRSNEAISKASETTKPLPEISQWAHTIHFDFAKSDLNAQAEIAMQALPSYVPSRRVILDGHTDSIGGALFNDALGLARARSVANWLKKNRNVPEQAINITSFGKTRPVESNDSESGRASNRRVTINSPSE